MPFTKHTPKALVEVGGASLLAWSLGFLRAAGCERLMVIGGYHYQTLVREANRLIPDCLCLENTEEGTQNATSLDVALRVLDSDALVIDVDYIRSRRLAESIAHSHDQPTLFVVDGTCAEEDVMRVQMDARRRLTRLSKTLSNEDATSAGMFFLPSHALIATREASAQVRATLGPKQARIEDVLLALNERQPVFTEHVGVRDWVEVDTPEELHNASVYVAEQASILVTPCAGV